MEASATDAASTVSEKEDEEAEDAAAQAASKEPGEVEATAPKPPAEESSQLRQTKSSLFKPLEGVRDGAYVLELVRNGKNAIGRLSPRAVEACAREGIKPEELLVRSLESFRGLPSEGLRERHVLKRHERYEEARLSRLDLVCATRLRLVEEGWPPTEEERIKAAAGSATVAEWRRRNEKQDAASRRRGEKAEEMVRQRGELEAFAAARSILNEKRKKMMEEERQAELQARAEQEKTKREEREGRVAANQAANERQLRQRQEAHDAHERARDARLKVERAEAAARREEEGRAREAKIRKAQDEESAALERQRRTVGRQMMRDAMRLRDLGETREQRRVDSVRRGLSKARAVEESQNELEGLIDLAAARTMVKLQGSEALAQQASTRQRLLYEKNLRLREKAEQRERCEQKAEEREAQRVQSMHEQHVAKELRKDAYFAQRAEELADRREEKEHKQRVKREQVERMRRVKEWEAIELERKNAESDAIYFHQKEECERLRAERMTANHQQAAAQAASRTKDNMSTTTMQPGPCDIDNRFFQTGTKNLASKRNAPQYSFGSLSETAAPRYSPGMEVELIGKDSPGPGTATHSIASVGGQLEKTTFVRKVPAFGFGKSTNDRLKPREAESAGPADTVVDKRALEFTRMRSTPAISFASPTDTELFRSSTAASIHGLVGLLHPSRTPGPATYDVKQAVKGNAGTLVQSKSSYEFSFGKTKRFISREINSKGPGPQHYSPSKTFCSPGLAF